MTKRQTVYSPRPMTEYIIQGLATCEASWISTLPLAHAMWNLFYLSVPEIDNLPGSGTSWWSVYRPRPGAMAAIVRDVADDEVLYRKLMMSRERFLDWFHRADHESFECFNALGGNQWVGDVMTRAEAPVRSNVTYVTFRDRMIA